MALLSLSHWLWSWWTAHAIAPGLPMVVKTPPATPLGLAMVAKMPPAIPLGLVMAGNMPPATPLALPMVVKLHPAITVGLAMVAKIMPPAIPIGFAHGCQDAPCYQLSPWVWPWWPK